jgi:hypothetical protein
VEKRIVCVAEDCRSLVTGLAALFAFYFVLNLKYQPEAEATLEFIQRWAYCELYCQYTDTFASNFLNLENSFPQNLSSTSILF